MNSALLAAMPTSSYTCAIRRTMPYACLPPQLPLGHGLMVRARLPLCSVYTSMLA